ncbi:carbohydrate-binding protein [Pedobacter frigiditerrae]|uniref:Carbohydrate-binding protein n=1 Tax=Pedobacter frigiditerrae TaxID=2530452 RepID=A0A4R0N413_9SPHI|nr:carbohydrate-binding protein [Pedobacter frigiditerrae]
MKRLVQLCAFASFIGSPFVTIAQNPIVQAVYTADPAPLVYKDTVFLYTGHDEDKSTWFTMKDWRAYSTVDMVNWTDRGSPLSLETFKWANKDAWAGQCTFRNGKFYWHVPVNQANGKGMAIGVAVSTSPTGPFKDVLGKPLVHSGNGDIDPTVFIDDNGQAYLYWGNPYLKYVKLNADMISYSGEVITVPLNKEGFSVRYKDADKRPSAYEEGPWLHKRKGLYYLLYAAGGVPEHLAYSTSKTATGPWNYRDTIMTVIKKGGAFTNHPGLIDYKGKSYFFYHNGALKGGGGFNRSVAVEEFTFNPDGSIPRIEHTVTGVKAIQTLNPYQITQAETIAWQDGIETAFDPSIGVYVTDISAGDYLKVRNVNLRKGPKSIELRTSAALEGTSIEIRTDSLTGQTIGTVILKPATNKEKWITQVFKTEKVITGIHDLFFVFKGSNGNLFNFDWWKFN